MKLKYIIFKNVIRCDIVKAHTLSQCMGF